MLRYVIALSIGLTATSAFAEKGYHFTDSASCIAAVREALSHRTPKELAQARGRSGIDEALENGLDECNETPQWRASMHGNPVTNAVCSDKVNRLHLHGAARQAFRRKCIGKFW